MSFVLTDVERSTWLWEIAPEGAAKALARQYELIDMAVEAHGGVRPEEQGEGDSTVSVFASAVAAVSAAREVQWLADEEDWPDGLVVRVRIGVHTGEARLRAEHNYTGMAIHRCARLRDAAHGGQILVSSVTASIVAETLPEGCWLVDRGEHRLRDLARPERVFELGHDGTAEVFPPLRSLDVLPNNLPAQLTSFVGRRGELAEIRRLLTGPRLVTLTGPGGCGKSRLALQAAADEADRWPDGVWWVDLGPITDPALVGELIAATLGLQVPAAGGSMRALRSQLRDRRLLVCLDTCEHVIDAAAEVADTLLRECPEVSVLATSREPLRVAGETVWQVPSLTDDEAVELFTDRAVLVHSEFTMEADTREQAVHTICRRLDGIPLAIELAAAWAQSLAPSEIAARLDDRFRLLVRGPRGVIERQQTLAASMEWSHRLLDATDRLVFRRLAVFAGGFSLEAAGAVCAADQLDELDVADALGRLVDKSLVGVLGGDGGTRYRLLDTVRQHARVKLEAAGEDAVTRDRHLDHFLALAERAEPELERNQDTGRRILELDHDNLRAALRWGLDAADPERGRRLASALAGFWFLQGYTYGGAFLALAIERRPDDRSDLQARLLSGAADNALLSGQPALAADAAARGWEIADANDDDRNRGRCLLASACLFYADSRTAQEQAALAQRYSDAADDPVATDYGLLTETMVLIVGDRHEQARRLAQDVYERAVARGDRFCAADARGTQAYTALVTGDVGRAHILATEALHMAEPLRSHLMAGYTTATLALVKGVAGQIEAGRDLLEPLVPTLDDAGLVVLSSTALVLGKLYLASGDLESAAAWFERNNGFTEPKPDNWVAVRALPALAETFRRQGRFDAAWHQADRSVALSRDLDLPNVLADALDVTGRLAAEEDPGLATERHHEALAVRIEYGLRTFYVDSVDALAEVAARLGLARAVNLTQASDTGHRELVRAVRLAAASDAARDLLGYPRPPIHQPDHDALLASVRVAVGDEAFKGAWSEGAALSLDDVVAYLRRARGARDRPSSGWASLTPTELDVVRLVVDGLTSPQIGGRLFMSRHTVKSHLTRIYAKLEVANRIELTKLANPRHLEQERSAGERPA